MKFHIKSIDWNNYSLFQKPMQIKFEMTLISCLAIRHAEKQQRINIPGLSIIFIVLVECINAKIKHTKSQLNSYRENKRKPVERFSEQFIPHTNAHQQHHQSTISNAIWSQKKSNSWIGTIELIHYQAVSKQFLFGKNTNWYEWYIHH